MSGVESINHRAGLSGARRLVIKIGSGVLVRGGVRFDRGTFCRVVEQVAALVESGRHVAVVSSGAVALGRGRLGGLAKPDRQRSLPLLQAMAAVGQTTLMQLYDTELSHYGLRCGQLLLTRDDLDDRGRYLNARHTLRALWELGAVPVINENDTVATDEIRVGDNDGLAARVASLIEADLLVILSDIDALYTANPRVDPEARPYDVVAAEDPALDACVSDTHDARGGVGTGGMVTKLEAARIAARRAIPTLVMLGKAPERLPAALAGEQVGTLFVPSVARRKSGRKAWIGTLRTHGRVLCDAGAERAVRERGTSLLPSGVVAVEGRFEAGEAVALCSAESGQEFARGLVAYRAADVERIAGARSAQIESLLGYHVADEVVHRDDLLLLGADAAAPGR